MTYLYDGYKKPELNIRVNDITVDGILNIEGDSDLVITSLAVRDAINVGGDVNIDGRLFVDGTSNLVGNVAVDNDLIVGGSIIGGGGGGGGNIEVDDLVVNGIAGFNGEITAASSLSVVGNISSQANITALGDLNIENDATIKGVLDIQGTITGNISSPISESVTVTGFSSIPVSENYVGYSVGNIVCLAVPVVIVAGVNQTSGLPLEYSALPVGLRPIRTIEGTCIVKDPGVDAQRVGSYKFTPAGILNIYDGYNEDGFVSASGNSGGLPVSFFITYIIN